ncbi:hypothetical protein SSTU70S_04710 [Stutzerimonas stutzeri]
MSPMTASPQRDLFEAIRTGRIPALDPVHPDHAGSRSGELPLPPLRPDQGLVEEGLPADRGRRLRANRNPDNYFADVEQAAFTPANVVPGISFSPDRMLQGRLFSYGDAQRYRLGVNHHQIPVNAPRCPVHSYHRDGAMRVDGNDGGRARTTSPTPTANGSSNRTSASRHWRSTGSRSLRLPCGRRRLLHAAG